MQPADVAPARRAVGEVFIGRQPADAASARGGFDLVGEVFIGRQPADAAHARGGRAFVEVCVGRQRIRRRHLGFSPPAEAGRRSDRACALNDLLTNADAFRRKSAVFRRRRGGRVERAAFGRLRPVRAPHASGAHSCPDAALPPGRGAVVSRRADPGGSQDPVLDAAAAAADGDADAANGTHVEPAGADASVAVDALRPDALQPAPHGPAATYAHESAAVQGADAANDVL